MKTYLYRASNLKSYHQISGLCFIAEVNFWHPPKTVVCCNLFIIIIIIIINFFRWVFSKYTEVNTTALVPLYTILPGICVFIIGFTSTVWTTTSSLQAIQLIVC